jgi:hypothetical protein
MISPPDSDASRQGVPIDSATPRRSVVTLVFQLFLIDIFSRANCKTLFFAGIISSVPVSVLGCPELMIYPELRGQISL